MNLPSPRAARFASAVLPLLLSACASLHGEAAESIPLVVSTWPFGKIANDIAIADLIDARPRLDAIEAGIREIERRSCDGSVGLGGRPNAAGYAQLDACIMDGPGARAGSVAAVEGIVHPITAARRVMENTKHVMLTGEGARWFALSQGVESTQIDDLEAKKRAWRDNANSPRARQEGHDTIALLVLDGERHVAGGCSTSGAGGKLPGRVGDSPILGSGLYVDEDVGAAGATGRGENVMRHCGTFLIVELMRAGLHPRAACEEAIHRIASKDPLGYRLDICFIAIDKLGRFGAAASNQRFPFAVTTAGRSEIHHVDPVRPR
ncbi:MAG: N(4)-(beta-N-acetylglucosaminyl)-L-asparaginase [Planctomycetes bacterium]|nr:N(4)-(beta-N-acetylglucosaminyl)-L-asparaginase [Planctomycetota bacterium]